MHSLHQYYYIETSSLICSASQWTGFYMMTSSVAKEFIPTFALLNCAINEQIDIKMRKILCMTGNFHQNSDTDRLYLKRKNGCRCLKCIKTTYEARTVAARRHLLSQRNINRYLACVINHEESKLLRVGREVLANKNIEDNESWKPSFLSRTYVREALKINTESFTNKLLHGYIRKKIIENEDVDQKLTDQWSNNKYILSHFEAYTCTIHEQEIGTKDLIYRRELKNKQQPTNGNKYRLCKVPVENVTHIISSCSKISSRYYLPI